MAWCSDNVQAVILSGQYHVRRSLAPTSRLCSLLVKPSRAGCFLIINSRTLSSWRKVGVKGWSSSLVDPVGGGLVRSLGGYAAVISIRKREVNEEGAERRFGSGRFDVKLLSEAE